MSLEFPGTEVLQSKTAALVGSLDRGIREGSLDPDMIRSLREKSPRTHGDLMLVYLGLRPFVGHLSEEVALSNTQFKDSEPVLDYLKHFPKVKEGGTDLSIMPDGFTGDVHAVWNYPLVQATMREHPDLFGPIREMDEGQFEFWAGRISMEDRFPEEDLMYGVIQGIPREAAELFARYALSIGALCLRVERTLLREGIEVFSDRSSYRPAGQFLYDENGVRQKVIGFLEKMGYCLGEDLLYYMRNSRPAQVPGFQYLTIGEISEHERELMAAYQSSGVEEGLDRILN